MSAVGAKQAKALANCLRREERLEEELREAHEAMRAASVTIAALEQKIAGHEARDATACALLKAFIAMTSPEFRKPSEQDTIAMARTLTLVKP